MKHKIIIDVGSTVQWHHCSPIWEVQKIDYVQKIIHFQCNQNIKFNHIDMKVYKYNGIPISEIESVEIAQPKDFSHIKVGNWVRSLVDMGNNRTKDKWYSCVAVSPKGDCMTYQSYRELISMSNEEWDLLDIRDENPNKPIGDE